MKNRKRILPTFLVFALVVLYFLQLLVMPKYMDNTKEGALIGEYYDNAGNNDVIFIGDCEVYENFSPITLWEEYGITPYTRGSAQQLTWQSYHLMEETFRYETPKVMVFNVLSMKYDTPKSTGAQSQREAYNRMTLDGMRWSPSKWNSILSSMTEEEQEKEAMYSYLFPILRYHDRWSDLKADDFRYWLKPDVVSDNGYLMQVGIKPLQDEHVEKPLADYTLGENSWYYLEKMTQLCKENGTQLVLIKAPALSPVWWPEWDEQVEEYAKENDLLYINMLDYQEEMAIDWSVDTYETGLHLNVYGAEIASKYLIEYIQKHFTLTQRTVNDDAAWQADLQQYYQAKN